MLWPFQMDAFGKESTHEAAQHPKLHRIVEWLVPAFLVTSVTTLALFAVNLAQIRRYARRARVYSQIRSWAGYESDAVYRRRRFQKFVVVACRFIGFLLLVLAAVVVLTEVITALLDLGSGIPLLMAAFLALCGVMFLGFPVLDRYRARLDLVSDAHRLEKRLASLRAEAKSVGQRHIRIDASIRRDLSAIEARRMGSQRRHAQRV